MLMNVGENVRQQGASCMPGGKVSWFTLFESQNYIKTQLCHFQPNSPLPTITKKQNQPTCPWADEQIKKMWHMRTIGVLFSDEEK